MLRFEPEDDERPVQAWIVIRGVKNNTRNIGSIVIYHGEYVFESGNRYCSTAADLRCIADRLDELNGAEK